MVRLSFLLLLAALLSYPTSAKPLEILLTNDDGYDAPGITVIRNALVTHGHKVTVVAPELNQSGASVSVTSGDISVEEKKAGIWAVKGKPADAVRIGLGFVLKDNRPDLVVSGANMGQNLGADANSSGTVGAAIMAVQLGVPAIAVSAGLRFDERDDKSQFASTLAVFPDVGDFIVRLIDALDRSKARDGALLPTRTLLNVNYPALSGYEIKGVKLAPLGDRSILGTTFEDAGGGKLRAILPRSARLDGVKSADSVWFKEGFVTISVLDGDWTAVSTGKKVWKRIRKLEP
jgi:5'-nucleotidase|tara:strand:- start:2162 stop:3031 length:870 start_codon:yes stop_codon:yes gene_type:complete